MTGNVNELWASKAHNGMTGGAVAEVSPLSVETDVGIIVGRNRTGGKAR